MNKILLVDDSLTDRKLIRRILESRKYEIVEADAGNLVTRKALEERPDLILLDVLMPGQNGFEVCRTLKRSRETESIPIVFVSAKHQQSDIYWGKLQGADDYLPKPFEPEQLLSLIDRLLSKDQEYEIDG